jgi:hypothetical protein
MSVYSIRGVELRVIPSWPWYSAGSDGGVYRTEPSKNNFQNRPTPYRLKGTPHRVSGRLMVTVARLNPATGKWQMRPMHVHILVAEAWLGARPAQEIEIDHKNKCRTDNHPDNLEYVTRLVNCRRAGMRAPRPRTAGPPRLLTSREVLEIRANVAAGRSIYSLARRLQMNYRKVYLVAKGITYRHVSAATENASI